MNLGKNNMYHYMMDSISYNQTNYSLFSDNMALLHRRPCRTRGTPTLIKEMIDHVLEDDVYDVRNDGLIREMVDSVLEDDDELPLMPALERIELPLMPPLEPIELPLMPLPLMPALQQIPNTTFYTNELDISYNRKTVWPAGQKKVILDMLYDAYYKSGMFHSKLNNQYNIVHVIKEIHTTEAGCHFNIQLYYNDGIVTKLRNVESGKLSNTLHCRVCTDTCGNKYISKFSEIVEWL